MGKKFSTKKVVSISFGIKLHERMLEYMDRVGKKEDVPSVSGIVNIAVKKYLDEKEGISTA